MIYRQPILTALEKHGALGLMDLRRKVSGIIGQEASRKILKEEVRLLYRAKVLNVSMTHNGFSISIKGATNAKTNLPILRRRKDR